MARVPICPILLFAVLCLTIIALSRADSSHHKVILHVPYKVHTIHHHSIKKIPIYHFVEHRDHHHHHHHHHIEPHHHEEHHHDEVEESVGGGGDWD